MLTNYFMRHWRGEENIYWALFVNGVLFYFALVALVVKIGGAIQNAFVVYVGLAAFFAWAVWATIGIFRSSFVILKSDDDHPLKKCS